LKRAAIYIDGQNWVHLLEKFGLDGRTFHFRNFAEQFLCQGKEIKTVTNIKYYGARYPREISLEKHNRDDAYYQALNKFQNITVVEARFRIDEVKSRRPPHDIVKVPQEKGVDVRLATDLIIDAFHNAFDDAYILSGDTDILPAVEQIKKIQRHIRIFCCVDPVLKMHEEAYDGVVRLSKKRVSTFIDPKCFPATTNTINALKGKFAPVV
jgi:uncharacterized LabA/DUF88 family protein